MSTTGARGVPMIMAGVMLAILVGPLNSTMIAMALPAIARDLDLPTGAESSLVTVYLIAMACLLPVAGKLGDRYGRRQSVLTGLVLFFVASAGAAASGSFLSLLAFRVLQAVGGALLLPNGIALLRDVVSPKRLGSTLGVVGIAAPLAAAAGPPLGGFLLELSGWRAVFAVNLVLLVLPVVTGWAVLPRTRRKPPEGSFDVVGSVLLCILLVAFTELLGLPGSGWITAVSAVVLVVSGIAFFVQARTHPDPVVALRLFKNPDFAAAAGGTLLSNAAMYGTLLTLPLLLVGRPGWTAISTGTVLSAMLGAVAVLTPVGGWLVDRFDQRLLAVSGFLVVAAGLAPLAIFGPRLGPLAMGVCLAGCGIGLGLANPAVQIISINAVDPSETGMAGGIGATSRYLGSITCSALLAGPLAVTVHHGGFGIPFFLYAAAAVAGAVTMAVIPERRRAAGPQPHRSAAAEELDQVPHKRA